MASIQQARPLPHLVWFCIACHLSDSLQTLLYLASLRPDLQNICRPHISAFFTRITRPVAPIPSDDYYYHHLLQLVLEGYIDPSEIREFHTWVFRPPKGEREGRAFRFFARDSLFRAVHRHSDATKSHNDTINDRLRDAIHASPFIPREAEPEIYRRFENGDPDAALAVLLPMCTKLKMLEIPDHSPPLSSMVVQRVAKEYRRRGITAEVARQRAWAAALRDRNPRSDRKFHPESDLPFSELLILCVIDHTGSFCSFSLEMMLPFMGLPSVHRIVLSAVREYDFSGWPSDIVPCTSPNIYFSQSSVSRCTILAFANGVTAPCEIRQWYEPDGYKYGAEDGGSPTWDRILVKNGTDGGKIVEARMEFDGGNPGNEHAWVSWLWHSKMIDWKRLDEPFSLAEGDEDNEWLGGHLWA